MRRSFALDRHVHYTVRNLFDRAAQKSAYAIFSNAYIAEPANTVQQTPIT